ncbi:MULTISPECIES: phosphotransferase [unclassified Paenibacillus]|uniref:Phosphotransferase enzyme family protein n=1 Tax=Paenibacillus provencensis TaxID=441151 RepID=A0ABW3PTH2_9BACL|nr:MULTISPECIES: phosphotransferase [unclassified Paenibacillus]MCM3127131.1 phosphotransferase [Paenibacillus sp. MER 78]SFS55734.1 Ser/Thr protein kinase RdoA involved in Cpx stress response, MazF antagonist [Paenibacillus sp. 453mf]
MTNEQIKHLLNAYEMDRPEPTFLRHNENRTYRVQDSDGNRYLLRIHEPFVQEMKGLQHTEAGILAELDMLEQWGHWSQDEVQMPVRNKSGQLVTTLEIDGHRQNASLLTWMEGRDLSKEDTQDAEVAKKLGTHLSELHSFFRKYNPSGMESRPSQGKVYNERMAQVIYSGISQGLFKPADAAIIEDTLRLVNSRLSDEGGNDGPDLIHGDICLGNVILTVNGDVRFIDFGFYGKGYAQIDTAMNAMMLPAKRRDAFLEAYYGGRCSENELLQLEGFMLAAIIGFYVFQYGNVKMHDWMRERMPILCAERCQPFLQGERIFYQ